VSQNINPAILATGLVKVFGETRAVDGLDLTVPAGTVYGLLGPNGAGKTTTIRMLATLTKPDEGEAQVFGLDVVRQAVAVRERISLTGQFASLDEDLTGLENLILLGRLRGSGKVRARARGTALIEALDLTEAADRQVKTYSGGMRRRLDIAASLIEPTDLLFLDEPTAGLDPRSRNWVWAMVRVLVEQGCTILLTTQYLEEADHLADRIAVIDHGRRIAEGTAAELKASVGSSTLHVRVADPETRSEAARVLTAALSAPAQLDSDPAALSIGVPEPDRAAAALAELAGVGVGVAEFSMGQPSLDEVFLALTGRPTEPATPESVGATAGTEAQS